MQIWLLRLAETRRKVIKKMAFKIVYKELSKLSLLMGKYSGSPRAEHFMYGVGTVMEIIANHAGGDELAGLYSDVMNKNMDLSEEIWREKYGQQGEVSEDLS